MIYNEGNFTSSRRLSDSLNTVEEAVNCAGNSLSVSTISSSAINTNDSQIIGTQIIEVRGVILKAEDGTTIEEILGNGVKTKAKEVTLEESEVLIGFYGSINGASQAI